MYLTVGEISKVLGISTEMIRFYVREGIIAPRQNEENGYWEYSSSDVMILSDILFYRDLDLPLKDIRRIFDGLKVEEIGDLIRERKAETVKTIKKYQRILEKLQEWEEWYQDEMALIGKFRIGKMPSELRTVGYLDENDHIALYLKNGIKINREDWIHASLSFYCNIYDKEIRMKRYLSVIKTRETEKNNEGKDVVEESASNCIYTQVHYSDNVLDMITPLVEYAKKEGYELTGDIYGRENTNYFVGGKRLGLYRVYAPLKEGDLSEETEQIKKSMPQARCLT